MIILPLFFIIIIYLFILYILPYLISILLFILPLFFIIIIYLFILYILPNPISILKAATSVNFKLLAKMHFLFWSFILYTHLTSLNSTGGCTKHNLKKNISYKTVKIYTFITNKSPYLI